MTLTQVKSKLSSIVTQAEEIKKSYLEEDKKKSRLWNLRKWYSFYKKRLVELEKITATTLQTKLM